MRTKRSITLLGAAAALGILILDSETAAAGARAGLELCIRSVIPALFPFLVLSALVTGNLQEVPFLAPLARICRMSPGAEGLLLTGLLAGYPVGAQVVTQAWRDGQLSGSSARRMLGFCSNAGPSFLFGILAPLFTRSGACWWLWGIHILSALLTGALLPGGDPKPAKIQKSLSVSLPEALQRSLRVMASICGWVLIFRVVIGFCDQWWFRRLPNEGRVFLTGLLELTNGCLALSGLKSEANRFVLCAAMLGFGGICVAMQTVSVTDGLGTGLYFPGKLLQAGISTALATGVQGLLYPGHWQSRFLLLAACWILAGMLLLQSPKIIVAISGIRVYNRKKRRE